MALVDAVMSAGIIPAISSPQASKKRYSEMLSAALAYEVASGLRSLGFPKVKPARGGPGEREFQGGLGPKKVDVSYADERHGLLLAVSVKSICFAPYGKNLKNRFGDLCTEAITLHMRFPYAVVGALFAMPEDADLDITAQRRVSTFRRAGMLFGTVSGRQDYSSPGERFEDITMLLFQPIREERDEPWVKFFRPGAGSQLEELTESEYFARLKSYYNLRNPHAQIEEDEPD